MPRLSANLLPTLVPANPGTPEDVTGEKVKGNGFYGFSDGLHTVAHFITGFVGTLEIQGALTIDPVEADWVTVNTLAGTIGDEYSADATYNFTGNFVWIRAKVTGFEFGTITKVLINY